MLKKQFLMKDYVIFEDFCNLRCDYCGGFYNHLANFSRKGEEIIISSNELKKIDNPYLRGKNNISEIIKKIKSIDNLVSKYADSPIIKLSGGEIFLFPESYDLINFFQEKYESVQILTNGTSLDHEKIKKLKQKGLYFQLSLDGHTAELNKRRVRSPIITKRIIDNLNFLVNQGFKVEINSVLTDVNTDKFEEFLKYLKNKYEYRVLVFPRPVRGDPRKKFFPTTEQIKLFEKIHFQDYSNILPPVEYFDVLKEVMNNKRNTPCLVPRAILGMNYDGRINFCTCSESLPRLELDNEKDIVKFINQPLYYSIKNSIPKPCLGCMNQYEVINQILQDNINLELLTETPYVNPKARKAIKLIKENYKKYKPLNS